MMTKNPKIKAILERTDLTPDIVEAMQEELTEEEWSELRGAYFNGHLRKKIDEIQETVNEIVKRLDKFEVGIFEKIYSEINKIKKKLNEIEAHE